MLAAPSKCDSPLLVSLGTTARWECSAQRAGSVTHPDQLSVTASEWISAQVPGTVASALDTAGRWDINAPLDIDAHDWWYRARFSAPQVDVPCYLDCAGLATLAEIWLNGQLIATTDNMFRSWRFDVTMLLCEDNELDLVFRSLGEEMKRKRPRPRWKTNLVQQQQLRWIRSSLLGRIPGWAPVAPAVGPWRDICLVTSPVSVADLQLKTRLDDTTGLVAVQATVRSSTPLLAASLRVAGLDTALTIDERSGHVALTGEARVPDAPLWWPHTHGDSTLCDCDLIVETADGAQVVAQRKIGFRALTTPPGDGFAVEINGQPIYCRGACWTVGDLLKLDASEASLRHDLQLARDAGVNMLRIGGTMIYESETFYRLCDELGILVWQDFMFANMDYPIEDPAFAANIATEAGEQLRRLSAHPCVAVYCGNSEIEQQAAMLGLPRELWRNDWFAAQLPKLCEELHPGTTYLPSTPTGGVLPFHTNQGVTHYYGVGAYLRSPRELRQADVRFTPECLGFANVPDPTTIEAVMPGSHAVIHDPRWKRRVPRDNGAGWDFEDVRDHYLRELYGVDPVQLRSSDTTRYLQLSRLVSGEMMQQAFAEWRSGHSRNQGGLVWFYKDLWPGAGWGIVDSTGRPKAAYYQLKRMWSSRQLTISDEGLNGLHLHLTNETSNPCDGFLEVTLLKQPQTIVARQEIAINIAGRSRQTFSGDDILGRFYDVSYAYRFGPPHHDVVMVTWRDTDRQCLSEAFHFIRRVIDCPGVPTELTAKAETMLDSEVRVTIASNRFLHGVNLNAKGYLPSDNYFHLPPQQSKTVTLRRFGPAPRSFACEIEALNFAEGMSIGLTS